MLNHTKDKTIAYKFEVNADGSQSDAKMYQDGRTTDVSWDGVWYSPTSPPKTQKCL